MNLVLYPHGLGDCILLTPVLREHFVRTGEKTCVMTLERFASAQLFSHNPYVEEIFFCADAWNDFPTAPEGFRAVEEKARQLSRELGLKLVNPQHQGHKISSNFQAFGFTSDNYQTEIWRSIRDKETAAQIIKDTVGDNKFGFVQTTSGVPTKDLPNGYGREWLRKNRGIEWVIEPGEDFGLTEFNINVQIEILDRADAVVVPDSVFYHACGALNKEVDLVWFSRRANYERVRPLHDTAPQNVVYELP